MRKIFTTTYLMVLLLWTINTRAQVTNGLIQHFKFDNSYSNEASNVAFSAASFTADRDGVPNGAILISSTVQSQATIPGLPYGNSARTISFWAKSNGYSGVNYDPVFTYGTGTNTNAFSGSFSLDRVSLNAQTDHFTTLFGFGHSNVLGTWYHFVMAYDGNTVKLYRNGILLGSATRNWNTINNSDIFKLGIGVNGETWFRGAIDDLKIFDRAVTDAEAELLYKGDVDVCSNLLTYFSFDSGMFNHTETVQFTTTDPAYPVATTLGRTSYALQTFQAATQPRTITVPNLPTGNSARTILFWLKTTTAFSTSQTFFTYGTNASAQTFGLYNNASGALVFQGFGAGNDVTATNATIIQNTWAQIAVTHNGHQVNIYVNGALKHSFTPTTTLNTGNSTFKIGSFNGAVDDLAIYSRALTFAEIESLYLNSVLNCPSEPGISAVSVSSIAKTTATVNYSLKAMGAAATSVVKYGLTDNNLSEQFAGFSVSNNTRTPGSAELSGLQPGTLYYYQIEATNDVGTATTSIGSFFTKGAIAEYTFSNNLNNVKGNTPFTNSGTSFVNDRHGNPSSAMHRTDATANTASIANLPIGTAERTVSLWIKSAENANRTATKGIFRYGTDLLSNTFGAYFNNTGGITFQGYGNEQAINNSTVTHDNSKWYHLVVSYNSTDVTAYINGNIAGKHTFAKALTTTNSDFRLGNFVGSVDELKIYNYTLSDTEVTNLYVSEKPLTPPTVSTITASVTTNSASINYTLNAEESSTTSVIKYGLTNNALTSNVTGFSSTGVTNTLGSAEITGLTSNTQYYYQIEATNADGTTLSTINSFTTQNTGTVIAEYTFNNTYNNISGNTPFANTGASLVTDRSANPSSNAMRITHNGMLKNSASIANLPTGASPRTFSIWVKSTTAANTTNLRSIFIYGSGGNVFGASFNNTGGGGITIVGNGDQVINNATINHNQWFHLLISYNGTDVRAYLNGELKHTYARTLTTVNSPFYFGFIEGEVDDLKIYNYALSTTDVTTLYNNEKALIPPTVSSVSSSNVTSNSASINYTLNANDNNTTSIVRYGLTSNNLSNQFTGFAATGYNNTPGSVELTGLTQNTQYFYQIEATNSAGTTTSATGDFITFGQIARYDFNNTYNNINGTTPFSSTNTTFGPDRNNNANSALIRNSTVNVNSASILNLPISATRRTISFWMKSTDPANTSSPKGIFLYGSGGTSTLFGAYFNTGGGITFQGASDQAITNSTIVHNQWFHFALSYDGTNVRAYINGDLKHTFAKSLGTTNSAFSIGNFIGAFDDLQIYNYQLSDAEITSLFTNNAVLPVNLKSFTAKTQNNSAVLNWETASETNNSHFVVNSSTDGLNFNALTTAIAKSANGSKYQFIDKNPANGANYYQLLQVDLDGKTTDLGVKSISFNLSNSTKVFPNPTTDKVEATFEANRYKKASLTDLNGKKLQVVTLSQTQTSILFELKNYPNGIYIIQLVGEKENTTQKIIKQ